MTTTPQTAVLGDPTGARAAAVMVKYAAPAAVLESPPRDLFEIPKLACNFADAQMQYPIHTPASAWTSAAGYVDAGGNDPEVTRRIKGAMVYHRLPLREWERLEKVAADSRPPEPTPVKYAFPEEARFPLDTAEQIEAASEYFTKYAANWDPASRRRFAAAVVEADLEGHYCLPLEKIAMLEAEAGLAAPNKDWRNEFEKRARLAAEPELKAALTKVATSLEPIGTFHNAGELAEMLRQVDKRMGWDFPNPIGGLTGETPSTAKAKLASAVEGATGDWYNVSDLDCVPNDEFVGFFGGGPVVTRAAKVAALRDPIKAPMLVSILEDYGAIPVSRTRPKLSPS